MNDDRQKSDERRPTIEIPHDVVNEQILLAAVLVDADVRKSLLPKLPASLFVDEAHRAAWEALLRLREKRIEYSLSTVYQLCSEKVELKYLEELIRQYPEPPANTAHHAAILRWDAVRAAAVRGPIADLLTTLRDPLAPRERVKALAKQISAAFERVIDREFLLDPVILTREHSARMAQRGVWPYGIDGFDVDENGRYRVVPGAEPGKITVLTGVSRSGKSSVAAIITLAQARMRRRVLCGAWEMKPGPTLELLAIMSLGWSRYDVYTNGLKGERLDEFRERMELIGTYVRFFDPPFATDFSRRYNNDEAIDELHREIAESGAEVAVLDLWERMIPDGSPDSERRALFRTQQLFAETRCHGLLAAQQKLKELENRRDKRPTLSTILGSQAWVDICDTGIGVHLPSLWEPAKGFSVMQLFLLKQRFANPKGIEAVEGDWDGDRCTLTNCRTIDYDPIGSGGSDAAEWLGLGDRNKFKG